MLGKLSLPRDTAITIPLISLALKTFVHSRAVKYMACELELAVPPVVQYLPKAGGGGD